MSRDPRREPVDMDAWKRARGMRVMVAAANHLTNELTIQLSAAQMALDELADDDPLFQLMVDARNSAKRAIEVVQSLQAWGHRNGVARIHGTFDTYRNWMEGDVS